MAKQNCWEIKKCGREPGGAKTSELGMCPVARETRLHGINSGINGGRACWAVAGTLCGGKVQGTYATKFANCLACDFFMLVRREEGNDYQNSTSILNKLK